MGSTRALPLSIASSVGSATIRLRTTVSKKAGPLDAAQGTDTMEYPF